MTGWLKLTDEQRKATIDQAEQMSGIGAKAIEKDWWVTCTLKSLFKSAYTQYLVFKGGTSLSKCWKLIARFSEDIDIALAPEAFGMEYLENPSKTAVERLKRKGCSFTSNELREELEKQIAALGVPTGMIAIEAAPVHEKFPDTDPQTLYVRYPTLYEPNTYITDEVKIEVSVRSLRTPYTTVPVQSLLNEINPNPAYGEVPFPVDVVEPRKTFLEKAFLLHEEFGKPDKSKIKTERMSRHLYDLGNIMHTQFGREALDDYNLYEYLIKHREWYSRISWVDYQSLKRTTISFIPPEDILETLRQDYLSMQEQMIYGDALPFDDLIDQLKILQGEFRKVREI
jgi:hypothetical protein